VDGQCRPAPYKPNALRIRTGDGRYLRATLRRRPPRDQLKPPLSRDLLKADLAGVERLIAEHEWAVELARDDRVGEVLQAIAGDPDLPFEMAWTSAGFQAPPETAERVRSPDSHPDVLH